MTQSTDADAEVVAAQMDRADNHGPAEVGEAEGRGNHQESMEVDMPCTGNVQDDGRV